MSETRYQYRRQDGAAGLRVYADKRVFVGTVIRKEVELRGLSGRTTRRKKWLGFRPDGVALPENRCHKLGSVGFFDRESAAKMLHKDYILAHPGPAVYRCQFCEKDAPITDWVACGGDTCPLCGRQHDASAAQDGEA